MAASLEILLSLVSVLLHSPVDCIARLGDFPHGASEYRNGLLAHEHLRWHLGVDHRSYQLDSHLCHW